MLSLPFNFQPPFGLEELDLCRISEIQEDGTHACISVLKLHQFIQASPGLQVLRLKGLYSASAADKSLQQVDLPNLEVLRLQGPPVLHLIRAEHCTNLGVDLESIEEKLPPAAWTTVVPTLTRAKGLEVELDVSMYSLRISSLLGPPWPIHLRLDIEPKREDAGHLCYAILEQILQELENESCISARIQLSLHARNQYDPDIYFKVLKLLQSPMPGPSSRWRLPHLDTVCIRGEGFPYQYLKAFVQARANAQGDQAPKAVTSILESDAYYGPGGKEILGEVMDYAGDEGVAEGAVVQAG
ncbi:hypothetical protein FRC04_007399 [Tulasnella sp. 424]|nr:hypothetical protein FRC04_007399 [Tulasnella sp. 424]